MPVWSILQGLRDAARVLQVRVCFDMVIGISAVCLGSEMGPGISAVCPGSEMGSSVYIA